MDAVQRNLAGIEAEKAGDIDRAIELYEQNVKEKFDGNHPYDRLAIIYHKQKKYDDEERVLLAAIDVFSKLDRSDAKAKVDKFAKRISKIPESTGIDAYRDRMSSPVGAIRIDPITRKPIKQDKK